MNAGERLAGLLTPRLRVSESFGDERARETAERVLNYIWDDLHADPETNRAMDVLLTRAAWRAMMSTPGRQLEPGLTEEEQAEAHAIYEAHIERAAVRRSVAVVVRPGTRSRRSPLGAE